MKERYTIKCADANDLLKCHEDMLKQGYECDFLYEKSGERGYWLMITREPQEENNEAQ